MASSRCLNLTDSASDLLDEATAIFRRDVLSGLSKSQKELHCKYLYDEKGSQLFDRICELPEYYLTRTEASIMRRNAEAIGEKIGDGAVIVEYGSGSSTKTRLLLDHLNDQRAYLPVDISEDHLLGTAEQLRADYPELEIHPIIADFTVGFDLPPGFEGDAVTVYFPGSTIGNLRPDAAVDLLSRIAKQCQSDGGLLIGFDLEKSPETLVAAYDDSAGVTAEFNLNLLHRINRELDGDFDLDQFKHVAIYNAEHSRIEIYMESQATQTFTIGDVEISFFEGERILSEYSHKYSLEQFKAMAGQAGFVVGGCWTDENELFAVTHLVLT